MQKWPCFGTSCCPGCYWAQSLVLQPKSLGVQRTRRRPRARILSHTEFVRIVVTTFERRAFMKDLAKLLIAAAMVLGMLPGAAPAAGGAGAPDSEAFDKLKS